MLDLNIIRKLYGNVKLYGPYTRKDKRKHVILFSAKDNIRKTISYPRILLEQKLGRKLTTSETADHIDEDCTNDSLDNLQIKGLTENIQKYVLHKFGPPLISVCPQCRNNFRPRKDTRAKRHFCSNSCRGKFYGNQYQPKRT